MMGGPNEPNELPGGAPGREGDRLRRFFMQAPGGICILDGAELVFELVNPHYQQLFPGRALLGKPVLEAVPEIKDQPIWAILQDVYTTGNTFEGKELLIPLARTDEGPVEDRFFNFIYQARRDEKGEIDGIMVFVTEVTDMVVAKRRIEEREGNLRSLVMTARHGMLILRGPDMVIEISNKGIDRIWNKPPEETQGRPLLTVFPELQGQIFPVLLRRVYNTGVGVTQDEEELTINHESGPVKTYVSFSYDPLLDNMGKVSGIVVSAEDVTRIVKAREAQEENYEIQQTVNEELAAANDELAASNEELAATNEELTETQRRMLELIDELARSDSRFRSLVQQAPVAIFVLNGRQMVVEAINDLMLRMLGKTADIIGMTYSDALPEFEGQPFFQLLDQVYTSGESFYGNEIRAVIEHDGRLSEGYYNFIYQPIKDEQGKTSSIICASVDVTEQVNARKKVERAEESLRLAIDAAGLGSYFINTVDRQFVASARLKEFFGFGPDEEVPYEAAINQIHPDYRQQAANAVEAAFTSGVKFDMEYPVIGYHDGKIRWVRGMGTVQQDGEGKNSYFTGVLHEITEKKQDEIRKNDFIGMVSHELKTPLTSLTAIVQLLSVQLADSQDEFVPNALLRANVQVKRMNNMINGFLNLSHLESGKIFINLKEFELEKLVKEIVDEANLTSTSHTIHFSECKPVTVHADRDKIISVISNLLNNAIKYSPKGERIDVKCETGSNEVVVSVKDHGMGILPKDLEKIFDRYYRVESHTTQHISGFGIGLYLSAEIIRRHGGRIWAESEGGEGTTFYFSLTVQN